MVLFKRILHFLIIAAVIIGLIWCGVSFNKYASYTIFGMF